VSFLAEKQSKSVTLEIVPRSHLTAASVSRVGKVTAARQKTGPPTPKKDFLMWAF